MTKTDSPTRVFMKRKRDVVDSPVESPKPIVDNYHLSPSIKPIVAFAVLLQSKIIEHEHIPKKYRLSKTSLLYRTKWADYVGLPLLTMYAIIKEIPTSTSTVAIIKKQDLTQTPLKPKLFAEMLNQIAKKHTFELPTSVKDTLEWAQTVAKESLS